jgi:hypothetical protein
VRVVVDRRTRWPVRVEDCRRRRLGRLRIWGGVPLIRRRRRPPGLATRLVEGEVRVTNPNRTPLYGQAPAWAKWAEQSRRGLAGPDGGYGLMGNIVAEWAKKCGAGRQAGPGERTLGRKCWAAAAQAGWRAEAAGPTPFFLLITVY